MASDDQSFPWEPIEPEGNTEDSTATPQEPTTAPSPFEPPTTTSSMPWVGQEWTPPAERRAVPPQEPTPTGQIPLARTPQQQPADAPFTEQATLRRFSSSELPTSARYEPPAEPYVLGSSRPAAPVAPWAASVPPATPAQPAPAAPSGFEPPAASEAEAAPPAQEEPRREPFTGAIPYVPREDPAPRDPLGTRASRRAAAEQDRPAQPAVSPFARTEPEPDVSAFQPATDQPAPSEPVAEAPAFDAAAFAPPTSEQPIPAASAFEAPFAAPEAAAPVERRSPFAPVTARPAETPQEAAPEPVVAEPVDAEPAAPNFLPPDSPAPEAAVTPQPTAPVRSPYLSASRPAAVSADEAQAAPAPASNVVPETPSEPDTAPLAEPAPEDPAVAAAADAWSPAARVAPTTAPIPLVTQAESPADATEARMPTRPAVPGTGSLPTVTRTPFATPSEPEEAAPAETPVALDGVESWGEQPVQRRSQPAEPEQYQPPRFAFTEPPRAATPEPEPPRAATPEPEPEPVQQVDTMVFADAPADDDIPALNPFDAPGSLGGVQATDGLPRPSEPAATSGALPSAGWEAVRPEPIEIDEDEDVVAPVPPPPASEIFPSFASSEPAVQETPFGSSQHTASDETFRPEPTDPVRELGASAVSTASLQAAGAPTPPSGIPMQGEDAVPAFGEEQPFVPRFEPIGGVTPAERPRVSFQAPAPRQASPLSNLELPALDEPAYRPLVDLAGNGDEPDDSDHPVTGEMPALRPEDLAPRAVAAVIEDEPAATQVEAEGDAAADEEVASAPRGSGPATPLAAWPFRVDAPQAEALHADAVEVGEQPVRATHVPPFRRDGSLDETEVEEAPFTPLTAPQFDDLLEPVAPAAEDEPERPVMAWASVLGQPADPDSSGAAEAPADPATEGDFTGDDLPDSMRGHDTEVCDVEAAIDPTEPPTLPFAAPVDETPATPAYVESIEPSMDEKGTTVTDPAARKRSLLWLWIVVGAVAVAGIAVAVYFAFLRPDAEILPTPTVTAEAPEPTAAPIAYVEPSAFLAQLPDTVGTDVLLTYTAADAAGDASLPARVAEHYTLEYGPGSGDVTSTVEAYQHYTVEDAQAAYDVYADGAIDIEDVTVGGEVVGERAYFTAGSEGTVVWRNNTAVFVLTGEADAVLTFYEHFGV